MHRTVLFSSHERGALRHRDLNIRPCTGVLCECHESCARYALIEGSTLPSSQWLGTCLDHSTGARAAYIDIAFVGPPHVKQFAMTRKTLRPPGNRRPNFVPVALHWGAA